VIPKADTPRLIKHETITNLESQLANILAQVSKTDVRIAELQLEMQRQQNVLITMRRCLELLAADHTPPLPF
jgi:hypothetical protein